MSDKERIEQLEKEIKEIKKENKLFYSKKDKKHSCKIEILE